MLVADGALRATRPSRVPRCRRQRVPV